MAAPRFFDDCVAPESTVILRIESCTFSLRADALDEAQRVQVLLNRAKGYAAQFWSKQASADLAEAKRLAPDDPAVTAAFADHENFLGGRTDRAIAGYKEGLKQNGDDADTLVKLGMAYLRENKPDLARESFDKALEADPDNVTALTLRSSFLSQAGQFDLALADLDRVVAAAPDDAGARTFRGQVLLYIGALDRGIEDLNIALKAHPTTPMYRFRGVAEYLKGDWAAAKEDFFEDLEFDPVYANLAAWVFLAERRRGVDGSGDLLHTIKLLNGRWPAPALKLLLGQATVVEALDSAAAASYSELRQVRESQTHAIIGEWFLLKDDRSSAVKHFKLSRDIGLVMAAEEMQSKRSLVAPDTGSDFILASQRLRELEP